MREIYILYHRGFISYDRAANVRNVLFYRIQVETLYINSLTSIKNLPKRLESPGVVDRTFFYSANHYTTDALGEICYNF